jgi:hypothetical protein
MVPIVVDLSIAFISSTARTYKKTDNNEEESVSTTADD